MLCGWRETEDINLCRYTGRNGQEVMEPDRNASREVKMEKMVQSQSEEKRKQAE